MWRGTNVMSLHQLRFCEIVFGRVHEISFATKSSFWKKMDRRPVILLRRTIDKRMALTTVA
jgi:hypothetical protein